MVFTLVLWGGPNPYEVVSLALPTRCSCLLPPWIATPLGRRGRGRKGPVPRGSATVEIQRDTRGKIKDIDLVSISSGRVQTKEGKKARFPFI